MAAIPVTVSLQSIYAGLGFALGFGWLWFPALQARWLPETLWGSSLCGSGALFLALLFSGFTAFAFWGRRIAARTAGFTRLNWGHAAHGASLLLVATALLPIWSGSGFASYMPAVLLAMPGVFQGIYWGGALLALPCGESVAAFLIAALAQAGLSFLYQSTPASLCRALMVISLAAAWVAAHQLGRLARNRAEESRRPRGRPPKAQGPAPAARAWGGILPDVALGAAFAVLIAGEAALPPSPAEPLWVNALLTACGAAAGFVLCRLGSPQRLLGPPLALAGLALVFFPDAEWSRMAVIFAQGMLCLPALAMLTQANPPCEGILAQRAARYLGIVLALSFSANAMLAALLAPRMPGAAALPAGILALLLAATVLVPFSRSRNAGVAEPAPKKNEAHLTPRESDILICLKKSMDDAQISAHLGIKETTVRHHIANMFRKTGYRTRAKLAAFEWTAPSRPGEE